MQRSNSGKSDGLNSPYKDLKVHVMKHILKQFAYGITLNGGETEGLQESLTAYAGHMFGNDLVYVMTWYINVVWSL